MADPVTVHIPVDALDTSGLPAEARTPGTTAFKQAVSELFASDLQAFGLEGSVTVTDDVISITWTDSGDEDAVSRAVKLLRSGDYRRGVRLLQILAPLRDEDPTLHFNLGAALSDLGRYDEARSHLERALELVPGHIDARTTLGLTYAREGRHAEAIPVLEKATRHAPRNPYAWRALGGTLRLMEGQLIRAEECLLKAAELVPDDPVSWLGLGEVREKLEKWDEATAAFKRCLALNPSGPLAEKAEGGINRITNRFLRERSTAGQEVLRMDAVLYIREALDQFSTMSKEQLQQVAYELALAGQHGIDLRDPTPRHKLKSLPGDFSAMKLVSFMYAAFEQFMPGMDVGIDLSREFAAAKR